MLRTKFKNPKTVTKISFVGNENTYKKKTDGEEKLWSIQSSLFSEIVKPL